MNRTKTIRADRIAHPRGPELEYIASGKMLIMRAHILKKAMG